MRKPINKRGDCTEKILRLLNLMYPDRLLRVDGQDVFGADRFREVMGALTACKWCEKRNGIFSDMRQNKKVFSLTLKGKIQTEQLNDLYDRLR